MPRLSIVIIGAGNLAQHIAKSLHNKKDTIVCQVFNHKKNHRAKLFAKNLNVALVSNYNELFTGADLYVIAVKDDAISEVATHLKPLGLNGLIVHTSGSVSLDVLHGCSANIGVYYPLQTFSSNNTVEWQTTPLLIETNTTKSYVLLKKVARSVSNTVKKATSSQRLQLHLAAVFASNFTNALWALSFDLVENGFSKKDTKLLLPLIHKTTSKLNTMSPRQAQTGPAKRNDTLTIKKHLALLSPQYKNIYKQLSELIQSQNLQQSKH